MRESELPNDVDTLKALLLKAHEQLSTSTQLVTQQRAQLEINKRQIESLEDTIKIPNVNLFYVTVA